MHMCLVKLWGMQKFILELFWLGEMKSSATVMRQWPPSACGPFPLMGANTEWTQMTLKQPCSILCSCPSCRGRPHRSWGSCHAVHLEADFKPCWNFRIWFGKYQDRKKPLRWDRDGGKKGGKKNKTGMEQRARRRDLGRQKGRGNLWGKTNKKGRRNIFGGVQKVEETKERGWRAGPSPQEKG